jgi:hypothetical protein
VPGVVESWGTVPVGAALGACEESVEPEGFGASIFMARDSWGCCWLVSC